MTSAGKIELLLHSKKKQLAVLIDPDKWLYTKLLV
jgi:hypothetical protein